MLQLDNLLKTKMGKHLLLGLLVLVIGIPVNYQLFSSWQKGVSITSTSALTSRPLSGEPGLNLLQDKMDSALHGHDADLASDSGNSSSSAPTLSSLTDESSTPKETALNHAKKHANPNYVCPMHPEIVTDDPEATCPICGMDLVVLESNGEAGVV
ncbi:MAG: hypothetical protein OEX07_15170, partial [Gammaproteobacteria bacterium]|nr:hypothetical protein [Gammaproteobacteria bacterium]